MRNGITVSAVVLAVLLSGSTTAMARQPAAVAALADPPGFATSAAQTLGWGAPNRVDEFDAPLGSAWNVYNGPGHAGKGRRTPAAVNVSNGLLTITGDSSGNTAGMAWNPGQKYGRWEGRVRAPASDPSYNALLLMWPDAEDFPVGGEIDFMEMLDPTRQKTNVFLHYGSNNSQVSGEVRIDGTQWHNWAVEWAPTHVAVFVDGRQWWRTDNSSIVPPRAMHLCIQLDWFPKGGAVRESTMQVDWVRQYPLRQAPAATTPPVTTAPRTTVPVTTAPVTTAPRTTAPVTTPPVTTAPRTAVPVTTPPVTTPPVTTPPVTTPPVTTAPRTTVPVTAAVTTVPVTTAPVTTAPVTTAPVTTAPVTTAPVTTAPVTTAPVRTAPQVPPVPTESIEELRTWLRDMTAVYREQLVEYLTALLSESVGRSAISPAQVPGAPRQR